MSRNYDSRIATLLNVQAKQVNAAISLLDEGNTIPFIARYRKEATFNLDEYQIRQISETVTRFRQVDERRETFLGTAEILEVFNITKVGKVAGCRVVEGKVERGAGVRLVVGAEEADGLACMDPFEQRRPVTDGDNVSRRDQRELHVAGRRISCLIPPADPRELRRVVDEGRVHHRIAREAGREAVVLGGVVVSYDQPVGGQSAGKGCQQVEWVVHSTGKLLSGKASRQPDGVKVAHAVIRRRKSTPARSTIRRTPGTAPPARRG